MSILNSSLNNFERIIESEQHGESSVNYYPSSRQKASLSKPDQGSIYNSCIRGAMLYASKCWALKKSDMDCLNRNECSMVRWMLGLKIYDRTSTTTPIQMLSIPDLGLAITCRRLRWFGHIKHGNAWTVRVYALDIEDQTP